MMADGKGEGIPEQLRQMEEWGWRERGRMRERGQQGMAGWLAGSLVSGEWWCWEAGRML